MAAPGRIPSAAERWRARAREAQADAARRESELHLEPAYAGERARTFAKLSGIASRDDPFLRRVLRFVGPATTVLDVGAGAGRYALALAPRARRVVAIDPSAELLEVLASEALRRGLTNVQVLLGRWEDVGLLEADVAVCYGVMGHVEDPVPFLRKLDRSTRRRVLIGVGPANDPLRDPLWRHFHGRPRPPHHGYLDLVAVLEELGIEPCVYVHDLPLGGHDDLPRAIEAYRDYLQLPRSVEIDAELGRVLSTWLRRDRRGVLRQPHQTVPWATVTWVPAGRREERPV